MGQLVITPEVVANKINNMKDNTSPGVDGIAPTILKETVEQVSHHIVSAMALSHRTYPSFISAMSSRLGLSPKCVQLVLMMMQISMSLAHVFNMSLREGIVLLEWKEANIIPLFKKGSRNKSVNYRPMSLTSVICKVLESIIRDHIMDFLIKHKFKKTFSAWVPKLKILPIKYVMLF